MKWNKRSKNIFVCALSALSITSVALGAGTWGNVYAQGETPVAPSTLFTAGKGITVSDNGVVPEWSQSGLRITYMDWDNMEVEQVNKGDLLQSQTHGVKAVSTSETSRLQFNNVINIDGNTQNDPIVEFLPVSSFRVSSADFTGMKIWMIDADDESNWVCVNMYAVAAHYGGATRIEAETSTGVDAAYRWGGYHDAPAAFYEGGRCDFYNYIIDPYDYYGKYVGDGKDIRYAALYEPFGIYYDTADMAIYISGGISGQKKCLMDLDDMTHPNVNDNNAFKGFKNNRIKVAFQTYNIAEKAEYIVLNVGGNAMYGTQVDDNSAPEILEKLPQGGIPTASVGRAFNAFDIEFYDFYDGVTDYQVSVKFEDDDTFTALPNRAFVPEKQGKYTLRYQSTDKAGNTAEQTYTVQAQYGLPPVTIETDAEGVPESKVGERVYIPQATAAGGSGPISMQIQITRHSDGAQIAHNGKYFLPYIAGEYTITYTARDYVGNVTTKAIVANVVSTKQPAYANELTMYKKFVSGIAAELPKVSIYDYDSLLGQRLEAKTTVTVTSVSNPTIKETVENYVFTPTIEKFGNKVRIEYSSTCIQYPNETPVVKTFEAEIVQPKYSWDYLWADDNTTIGYNTQYDADRYASLTAKAAGNVTVGYINPLQAEGLTLQFDVDEGKDLFDKIRFTLTDFANGDTVELYIYKDETDPTKTMVEYDGVARQMSGSFGGTAILSLRYLGGQITDYADNVVAQLDGFNGFASKKVWVEIALLGASKDACLKLNKIGSQTLGARYRSGNPREFTDSVAPSIALANSIVTDAEINAQVAVSSALAFDACTPFIQAYVTVTAPNGRKIYDKALASEVKYFRAEQYGTYTITYGAVDSAKNDEPISYYVAVYDKTKPVLVYEGQESYTCKLGETLQFSSARAYDAVDETLTIYVFIITPRGRMIQLTGDPLSYKFVEKGAYTLRYYAYDSNFNYDILDVPVQVGA